MAPPRPSLLCALQLEQFFTHGGDAQPCAGPRAPAAWTPEAASAPQLASDGALLLRGPRAAGLTSLLLQLGFSQARAGRRVVLVLRGDGDREGEGDGEGETGASQSARRLVPLAACARCGRPAQTGEDNGVWSRIHIKYLGRAAELQRFVCSLQVVDAQTSVLLVDALDAFFADRHAGDVCQTLAYLLEAREYMEKATGAGVVVATAEADAWFLRDRSLLRRWCRFLEVVPDSEEDGVFTLREEVESAEDVSDEVARTQIQYAFSPPDEQAGGTFELLHVQTRSG